MISKSAAQAKPMQMSNILKVPSFRDPKSTAGGHLTMCLSGDTQERVAYDELTGAEPCGFAGGRRIGTAIAMVGMHNLNMRRR